MKEQKKAKRELLQQIPTLRQRVNELKNSLPANKGLEEELSIVYDALNSSLNGIIITGLEGEISYANPAFLRMFEYSGKAEVIGRNAAQLFPSEKVRKFSEVEAIIDGTKGETGEFLACRNDGTLFNVEVSSSVITNQEGNDVGQLAFFADITERKQAEEKLRKYHQRLEEMVEERTRELRQAQDKLLHQERLAVLGGLAGGVAHELRNPLGAIKNAVYFLKMALEGPEPEVKETLEILQKEIATCETIISGLLDFARPKPPALRRVDVNDLVQETLNRITIPGHIRVEVQLNPALPNILADPVQLLQAFANIVLNAVQAMPEGGRLTIKSGISGKRWVALSFADTGVGIPQEDLKRLFNPLFTTKAKGIGLGLAISKILTERHQGHIDVQSKVGDGSTFTIKLPIAGGGKDR
jgi:PAS domain S-box-containing protein